MSVKRHQNFLAIAVGLVVGGACAFEDNEPPQQPGANESLDAADNFVGEWRTSDGMVFGKIEIDEGELVLVDSDSGRRFVVELISEDKIEFELTYTVEDVESDLPASVSREHVEKLWSRDVSFELLLEEPEATSASLRAYDAEGRQTYEQRLFRGNVPEGKP